MREFLACVVELSPANRVKMPCEQVYMLLHFAVRGKNKYLVEFHQQLDMTGQLLMTHMLYCCFFIWSCEYSVNLLIRVRRLWQKGEGGKWGIESSSCSVRKRLPASIECALDVRYAVICWTNPNSVDCGFGRISSIRMKDYYD